MKNKKRIRKEKQKRRKKKERRAAVRHEAVNRKVSVRGYIHVHTRSYSSYEMWKQTKKKRGQGNTVLPSNEYFELMRAHVHQR